MNSKLKISVRILLGYLVPCVIFSATVLVVYLKSLGLEETVQETGRAVTIVEHGWNLQLQVAQLQRAARGVLLTNQGSNLESYEQSQKDADKLLIDLKKLVNDQEQIAILNRIGDIVEAIAESTRHQIDRVKAGQVAEAVKAYQGGQSEDLYQSFSTLATQFHDRAQQMRDQLRTQAGNESAAINWLSGSGLLVSLVVALFAGLWVVRKTVRGLKEMVAAIASSVTQISATTEQHEGSMTQQASAVAETTATVEEMVATARINAEQAESAAQSANDTQETTKEGLELVTHNESDMAAMEDTMNKIAQQIIGLSEQAGQIGEIARVVSELAAETNMLALNAAVEAARAGEQGKGFAVVASEVRKLADQSKKSAERANQIVGDIQRATNGMVMTAEDGSKTTHSAAQSARLASAAFEKVIHLADAVFQNAQQVLLNSKQQAVALSQIDIAMKNISNGAREMSSGTVQIRDGMVKLSGVAGELQQVL
jgi:methyl-accepting chemotaxis protein